MMFELRMLGYRFLKAFMKPVVRLVPQPRPVVFVGPDASLRLCRMIGGFGFRRVLIVGGTYGVPHGQANAITLPYELDFIKDAPYAEARLAELAVAIGAGSADVPRAYLAQRFVDRVRQLNRAVGIPEKLAPLQRMCATAWAGIYPGLAPAPARHEDVMRIYPC
jgi:alcohol dehydrogenase class IV